MTARESRKGSIQHGYTCICCGRKISKWNKPSSVCLRCAKYGRPQDEDINRYRSDALRGTKHYGWKGNNASYSAIHKWVYSELGKATYCSNDETHRSKKYHWANISGEYRRDVNDYKPLCISCHSKYDMTGDRLETLRENAAKAKLLNRKSVSQYTKSGNFIETYSSIKEAAHKIAKSPKRVSDALTGRKKTAGGYVWRYAEPTGEGATV